MIRTRASLGGLNVRKVVFMFGDGPNMVLLPPVRLRPCGEPPVASQLALLYGYHPGCLIHTQSLDPQKVLCAAAGIRTPS